MDFKYVYKICNKMEWIEAKKNMIYKGSKKDIEDGYIHFSNKEHLKNILDKFFSNQKDLVLLKIEALKLDNLIYEQASNGEMYPHLYSSLDTSFVVNEYEINLNKDGSYDLPIEI